MSQSPPASSSHEVANIHLRILGEERALAVDAPLGERTLLDVLPAARRITEAAAGVASDCARDQGHPVRCRQRCSACCRHLVAVSPVEAVDLADYVRGLSPEEQTRLRGRFDDTIDRLRRAGLVDEAAPLGERALKAPHRETPRDSIHALTRLYFQQQIPCPFLEDELCSVYERRPMVCREHYVTSPPECCADLEHRGVEAIRPPIDMAGVLARAATAALGVPTRTIPLPFLLEWADRHGETLRRTREGLELLQIVVSEIDSHYNEAFDRRSPDGTA